MIINSVHVEFFMIILNLCILVCLSLNTKCFFVSTNSQKSLIRIEKPRYCSDFRAKLDSEDHEQENFVDYLKRTTKNVQGNMVAPTLLRNLEMTSASGTKKAIGDIIGEDLSVVVFLRHLG